MFWKLIIVILHTWRPCPTTTSLGLCSSLLSYWEITGRVTHILKLCAPCLFVQTLAHHYQTKNRIHCICAYWVASSHCCVARIVFRFSVDPTRSGASFSSSDNLEYRYFLHISLCKFRDLCLVICDLMSLSTTAFPLRALAKFLCHNPPPWNCTIF